MKQFGTAEQMQLRILNVEKSCMVTVPACETILLKTNPFLHKNMCDYYFSLFAWKGDWLAIRASVFGNVRFYRISLGDMTCMRDDITFGLLGFLFEK